VQSISKYLSIIYIIIFLSSQVFASDDVVRTSAHDLYVDLIESSLTLRGAPVSVDRHASTVTYGAESEGSSARLVRALGPNSSLFKEHMLGIESEAFLRRFMKNFVNGTTRNYEVIDIIGRNLSLTQSQMNTLRKYNNSIINYDNVNISIVKSRFKKLMKMTKGSPFSFLKHNYRRQLFLGTATGQRKALRLRRYDYHRYTPHFGISQKYVTGATDTSKGWEILFEPQPSYAQFEEMIKWYRTEFGSKFELFKAPGHQRMVYPKPTHLSPSQQVVWNNRMNEILRHIQAYVVIRGLQGNTGIENASYKTILRDSAIDVTSYSTRGVIRLDMPNRFKQGHYGLELRAGTKDVEVRQFVEQIFSARVATLDFSGVKQANSWDLIPSHNHTYKSLMERFGVSKTVAKKFLEKINNYGVKLSYQIALWQWENAPYLKNKKTLLKQATRNYIEQIVAMRKSEVATEGKTALKRWIKIVKLESAVHEYMRPERIVRKAESLQIYQRENSRIDVNKIDLGIEYSGRFQGNYLVGQSENVTSDGTKAWVETRWDMTPYERRKAIHDMASQLSRSLNNGHRVTITDVSTPGAHGHGLSIAYSFRDRNGGKWRVEWDGVGRTYRENGTIVPESLRGGHIEIVTPKYVPNGKDIKLLYQALAKQNIIPSHKAGGGHINIDLAPFEGNPKALARFLTIFHEHRGIMSYMFTNIARTMVAEPIAISSNLAEKLRTFNGSELELKRLLYNERYFNQRVGRKTRNVQADLSAYFQDVIPAEHIHSDFDIKNPTEPWRPQFRVEPHIRKMEFRMFDAPLDVFESSMQIKLIRAMLHQALNETTSVEGRVQEVNHEKYAENYDVAERDLKRMCEALGLNAHEYKVFVARSAAQVKKVTSSRYYKSYEQKALERGWKEVPNRSWGDALTRERSSSRALSSSERAWRGTELPEAKEFRLKRIAGAREGEVLRANTPLSNNIRREIKISVNCRSVFR
jgi:hypothetical protein